jgi:hypothetical protein
MDKELQTMRADHNVEHEGRNMISMGRIQGSLQKRRRVVLPLRGEVVQMPPVTPREDRPANTPADTEQRGASVSEFVEECRGLARQFEEQAGRSREILYWALAKILQLDILIGQAAENRAAYKRMLAERHIRITKASEKNRFTPMVKLVFGKIAQNNISRYASTLRYASINNIRPSGLPAFIGKMGGLAKCASLDRKEDDPAAARQAEHQLAALRASGAIELMECLARGQSDGLFIAAGEMLSGHPSFYRVFEIGPKPLEAILKLLGRAALSDAGNDGEKRGT